MRRGDQRFGDVVLHVVPRFWLVETWKHDVSTMNIKRARIRPTVMFAPLSQTKQQLKREQIQRYNNPVS